jgi:glycosyltransferase involved in cell wall biosynthesis
MTILNLTTVVLAHQLNQQFKACLESLLPSQEILIVWNGSKEETKKISLPKQAILIHETHPIADFASVRNKALSLVTTQWCLMIDSDEIVPPETWLIWHN